MIKNIEELKNIQIVCRNQEQVKNCLNYIKQLGLDVEDFTNCCNGYCIIYWGEFSEKFVSSYMLKTTLLIEFYNKKLVKTLQKFIKEKEKEKEKLKDFEVDENGRIIKINNYQSKKIVYYFDTEKGTLINKNRICHFYESVLNLFISCGYVFDNKEALDNYIKYLIIHTKLKNLANRLNNGENINFKNIMQSKFYLGFDYEQNQIIYDSMEEFKSNNIYCLNENFLEEAIKEIGEGDLKWYLQQSY